jgi:ribonucleoside-diphosphate reductase alpha chain
MWENRNYYNGLSVLPYDGGTYKQAPLEDCDEFTYINLLSTIKEIDLTQVQEIDDNTNLSGEIACAGGACEVKYV